MAMGNAPKEYKLVVDSFKGVDLANSEIAVNSSRSVHSVNMIADLSGKVLKRSGYECLLEAEGRINGIHRLKTAEDEVCLVHAGERIYKWDMTDNSLSELYSEANDARSMCVQYNGKLVILDGKCLLVFGEFDGELVLDKAENRAYVPTVVIVALADAASCGGTAYENVNLLTGKRYVEYAVTSAQVDASGALKFYIPEAVNGKAIDTNEWLVVEKIDSEGEWQGVVFSVDGADEGYVSVNVSDLADLPITQANVRVGYYIKPKEDAGPDLVNGCCVGKLYGVNGNTNRLFIGANEACANKVFYSGLDDMLYFPDQGYVTVGADSSKVMGFSRIGDSLGVHKEDNGQDSSVFLISGGLDSYSKAYFTVKAGVNSAGAVSHYAFSDFSGEPLFLSRNGVLAVTTQEITFEKYAENRSYFINPKLLKNDLRECVGIEFNNYYYLSCANGDVWVADGRQKVYEKNQPMSSFQYEWYYWKNVPARIWWEYDGCLYFGTADGKVMRMFNQAEHSGSHNVYYDDGVVVRALWDTPYFYLKSMNHYKNLKRFVLMPAPFIRSGVKVYFRANGKRSFVREKNLDMFSFSDIDFTRFTFLTDDAPVLVAANQMLKKFMMVQFRFENDRAEPFSLYGFEVIYTINAKYKA